MESTKEYSAVSVILKTAIVHTITYFLIGLLAVTFLDYAAKYADPVVGGLMRQTNDPWVAAGPLFQVLRGMLFGVVVFLLRDIVLARDTRLARSLGSPRHCRNFVSLWSDARLD